jgi:phosphoserine aminotransferase
MHNFNAGPAVLPAEVIQQIQAELPNYQHSGISILELSHRSKEYEALNARAMTRIKRLLGLGDNHQIGFLQGGASHQFAMLPMNVLQPGRSGAYVLTGVCEKAYEEACRVGSAHVAASSKTDN